MSYDSAEYYWSKERIPLGLEFEDGKTINAFCHIDRESSSVNWELT